MCFFLNVVGKFLYLYCVTTKRVRGMEFFYIIPSCLVVKLLLNQEKEKATVRTTLVCTAHVLPTDTNIQCHTYSICAHRHCPISTPNNLNVKFKY